jgi:hypothetical protein
MKNKTQNTALLLGVTLLLGACASTSQYQPLPPVKVITETVEVEIYAPPLPPQIDLQDVAWKVISNYPCRPATGKDEKTGLFTYDRFEREEYVNEAGETKTRLVRDADNKRVELPVIEGEEVCGNLDEQIYEVEKLLDGEFVVFALTPSGYQALATNLQEIRRYVAQQKDIIYYYREATAPKGKEGWLEENKERQQNDKDAAEADNETPTGPAPDVQETKSAFSLSSLLPSLGSKD